MAKAAQRKVGRAAFLLLGAACVSFFSVSSAFFSAVKSGSSTPETVADSETAKVARKEAAELFKAGPYFLKMAFSVRDLRNLKIKDIADKAGVRYRIMGRGQYCPWAITKNGLQKKTFVLSGTKEAISDAFKEIRDSTASSSGAADERRFLFLFPRSLEGEVIGKDGDNVKRFEEETSTKAFVLSHPGLESSLNVKGNLAADKAVEWLLSLAPDDEERRRTMLALAYTQYSEQFVAEAECVIYVPVPKEKIGRVIGKGGERIALLSREFHTKIELDNEQCIMKLTGISGDVHALHTHLILGPLAAE